MTPATIDRIVSAICVPLVLLAVVWLVLKLDEWGLLP